MTCSPSMSNGSSRYLHHIQHPPEILSLLSLEGWEVRVACFWQAGGACNSVPPSRMQLYPCLDQHSLQFGCIRFSMFTPKQLSSVSIPPSPCRCRLFRPRAKSLRIPTTSASACYACSPLTVTRGPPPSTLSTCCFCLSAALKQQLKTSPGQEAMELAVTHRVRQHGRDPPCAASRNCGPVVSWAGHRIALRMSPL